MIYFDNAATTPLDEIAIDALKEYGVEKFFNPSALYREALENTKTLNAARENILKIMHGDGDFIFTASGTEADNMAIYGVKKPKNARIIVSASEHSAMLNPATDLLNKGYDVVFAPLNPDGSVNIDEFKKLLNKDVCFVSIMHVNNETGAVNDLQKIVKLTKSVAPKSIVHSDGVQALMKVKVNLMNLGVDMYSVSAHKVHAPRGVGGLYIRKGVRINPLILGGGQEKGLRSAPEGTVVQVVDKLHDTVRRTFFTDQLQHRTDIQPAAQELRSPGIGSSADKSGKTIRRRIGTRRFVHRLFEILPVGPVLFRMPYGIGDRLQPLFHTALGHKWRCNGYINIAYSDKCPENRVRVFKNRTFSVPEQFSCNGSYNSSILFCIFRLAHRPSVRRGRYSGIHNPEIGAYNDAIRIRNIKTKDFAGT